MCSDAAMNGPKAFALALLVLAVGGCNRPISDPEALTAVRREALTLMKTHPLSNVPERDWPTDIASLRPEAVTIQGWGVDITTKRHFDEGWGYDVPRNKADLPMPASCYSEPSQGVFWHGPC